eukprot:maker-scaffold670_size114954-snap-gene-0.18 protein:Tk01658 transcript:maker-scaffold670_size114954-snap-gene-0.18-mRNA-1 annotation:"wd repeat-containing protein 59 isoform x1"
MAKFTTPEVVKACSAFNRLVESVINNGGATSRCGLTRTPSMSNPEVTPLSQPRMVTSTLTREWSTAILSTEHIELQATAMGLDCRGQMALLGGKKYLGLVSLAHASPSLDVVSKLSRPTSKWEAAKISWNPNDSNRESVAMSWNDRVELFQVRDETVESVAQLRFHSRIITDFDWNHHDPNCLASSSLDSLVYQWDTREPANPVLTFNGMVPISHVRWNRHNAHQLVTTHEGEVKIWDQRRVKMPLQFISAHSSRILSIDWSQSSPNQFVTSGQDCTVKFFDLVGEPKRPDKVLKTAVPVFRARYTPFGEGLVTVIIPQLHRNDNTLFLWNTRHMESPLHCFFGHKDVILDFDWRVLQGTTDMEMVTWSRDHTLRMWKVSTALQNQCGVDCLSEEASISNESDSEDKDGEDTETKAGALEAQESLEDNEAEKTLTRSGGLDLLQEVEETPESLSSEADLQSREATPLRSLGRKNSTLLAQEFQSLDMSNIKYITIESLDWARRTCRVSASFLGKITFHRVFLRITFPRDYPRSSAPMFTIGRGTTLDIASRTSIVEAMKMTANQHVRRNLSCLEPCLLQLEALIDQMRRGGGGEPFSSSSDILTMCNNTMPGSMETVKKNLTPPPPSAFQIGAESDSEMLESNIRSLYDSNVPYPRISGARFCSNDYLVVFCQTDTAAKLVRSSPGNTLILTPRALPAFESSLHLCQQLDMVNSICPINSRGSGFRQSPIKYQGSTSSLAYTNSSSSLVNVKQHQEQSSLKTAGRFNICRVRSGSSEDVKIPMSRRASGANSMKDQKVERPLGGTRVAIYNISTLLPIRKSLALSYLLPVGKAKDRKRSCLENARIAAREGFDHRARAWQICAQVMEKVEHKAKRNEIPWSVHPLGRVLFDRLINQLIQHSDIQTAALMVCFLKSMRPPEPKNPTPIAVNTLKSKVQLSPKRQGSSLVSPSKLAAHYRSPSEGKRNKFWFLKPGALPLPASNSPYHTIHIGSTNGKDLVPNSDMTKTMSNVQSLGSEINLEHLFTSHPRDSRSNSWSDALEEEAASEAPSPSLSEEAKEDTFLDTEGISKLLDPALEVFHDRLKFTYANVLQNWGLMIERCALLKNLNRSPCSRHFGLEMTMKCYACDLDTGFHSQCP